MIEQINHSNFKSKTKLSQYVVVDFFATWCGPCKLLAPVLDNVASKLTDIKFFKFNVEEELNEADENIPKLANISSLPTVVIYKDGTEISRFSGFLPADEIIKRINAAKG